MERIEVKNYEDIKTVACLKEEQETVINISRTDDTVEIWTSDNTMVTRLGRMLKMFPNNWKCYEGSKDAQGNLSGYFFECPKRAISFRSGEIITRNKNSSTE